MYSYVRNNGIGRVDVLGRNELWTISGINSINPHEKPYGPLVDYVAAHLGSEGMDVNKSEHSNLGTIGFSNLNYICPADDRGFVLHPWSKIHLDAEAKAYAERCCKRKEFCSKKICVVMIAPKTSTAAPLSGCCDLTINVWWDPYDPVPNQGAGGTTESQQHWSSYGTAYPVQSSNNALVGNHGFLPFMKSNPMYDPSWTPNPLDAAGGNRPLSGNNAPNPMAVIKNFNNQCDITIVCHSQGCNIAMEILNRGCKK